MTYFEDLSPYSYSVDADSPGDGTLLNVGWLGEGHSYPVGVSSDELIAGLVRLCADPVNLTRGVHFCDICPAISPDEHRSRWREFTTFQSKYGEVSIGNGELRAIGTSGRIYAAPTLVIHYVAAHYYLPPEDFVDAVVAAA
ncbi:DUF7919 family protein [Streptacidiphilus sp. PAMC 29251]